MLSTFLKKLHGKEIHIVGLTGSEGAEIALFLSSHGVKQMHLHDFSTREEAKKHFRISHSGLTSEARDARFLEVMNLPAAYHWNDDYLTGISHADIIFVPQSWYLYAPNTPLFVLEGNKDFWNLTKLYFHLFPGKIIGITGSNGKTTTTNLIYEIFKNAERHRVFSGNVYLSGNDRLMTQMLDAVTKAGKEDTLILEISNRQLRLDLGKSPDIGVITNITPNHLHEYSSFTEYKTAKETLLKHQTLKQTAVLNYEDKESCEIIERGNYQVFGFSIDRDIHQGVLVHNDKIFIRQSGKDIPVCSIHELKIPGKHNVANCLAAAAAAHLSGIPVEIIAESLREFHGVPQRLELVDTVSGRLFYNDTSATTPESTCAALASFDHKSILIMGGKGKGGDYAPLQKVIANHVRILILLKSPLADDMQNALKEASLRIIECETLRDAVQTAFELSNEGEAIIFSPAGEYFSYFQEIMPGYRNFRTFVEQLKRT